MLPSAFGLIQKLQVSYELVAILCAQMASCGQFEPKQSAQEGVVERCRVRWRGQPEELVPSTVLVLACG
jgi:hypothetical protein